MKYYKTNSVNKTIISLVDIHSIFGGDNQHTLRVGYCFGAHNIHLTYNSIKDRDNDLDLIYQQLKKQ